VLEHPRGADLVPDAGVIDEVMEDPVAEDSLHVGVVAAGPLVEQRAVAVLVGEQVHRARDLAADHQRDGRGIEPPGVQYGEALKAAVFVEGQRHAGLQAAAA
ncbi:MAG: hypothetical protein ACK559_06555, partial [bacterium]